MMIQEDKLAYGVEYPAGSGVLHYDFAMRLPTIADNVAAIEEVGVSSSLRMNVAMLARCLTRLGTIPSEAINTDLLDTMIDDDYDVLAAARDALKKKRKASSDTSRTIASPSSSSAATASPSQLSAS